MKALVTGSTGFIGRHLVAYLRAAGHAVDLLGRSPGPGVVQADLAAGAPTLARGGYDVVYHVAGKAHVVPRTEAERQAFFAVNAAGTKHLLDALDAQERPPGAFVLVSTVAVYGREAGEGLDEETPCEATDPYGLSKRQAEDAVLDWGARRGVRVGIARLPLVAGAGAPGNLGAMVRAIRRGRYLGIGDGRARRSMVLAGDVARVLPVMAERGGIYHLTDGRHPSFAEVERAIAAALGKRPPRHLPSLAAQAGARVGDVILRVTGIRLPLTSRTLDKMTSTLTFDDSRARQALAWAPSPVLDRAAEWVGTEQAGGHAS